MKTITKPQQWQARQVTCKDAIASCRAVLEVDFSDLKRIHHPGTEIQREPDWDEVFVICPECGNKVRVNDVPQWQVARIPEERP